MHGTCKHGPCESLEEGGPEKITTGSWTMQTYTELLYTSFFCWSETMIFGVSPVPPRSATAVQAAPIAQD